MKLATYLDCDINPIDGRRAVAKRSVTGQLSNGIVLLLSSCLSWQYILQFIYKTPEIDYSKEPIRTRFRLSEALVKTAIAFEKKYNRPMILVLDQTDRVAKQDPEFLRGLQDFTKSRVNDEALCIIFVANEGMSHVSCIIRIPPLNYMDLNIFYLHTPLF